MRATPTTTTTAAAAAATMCCSYVLRLHICSHDGLTAWASMQPLWQQPDSTRGALRQTHESPCTNKHLMCGLGVLCSIARTSTGQDHLRCLLCVLCSTARTRAHKLLYELLRGLHHELFRGLIHLWLPAGQCGTPRTHVVAELVVDVTIQAVQMQLHDLTPYIEIDRYS